MADIANMERERLSERTKLGLSRAVSQGKKLGRPKGSKDSTKRKRTGYLPRYSECPTREKAANYLGDRNG
jgi:DNA invertase Pin-like site-specific DNA recombinase